MTPQPGIPDHELDDPQSPVEDHSIEIGLGHRVRALRTSRGMSVAALSERASLSKAMLSKIENAQTSCSLTSVAHLAAALDGNDLPPGDFVRHCRQVIDLLEQLTADERLGATARAAITAVRRGLVAQEIDR